MIEGSIINFTSNKMLERLKAKLSSERIQRYLTKRASEEVVEVIIEDESEEEACRFKIVTPREFLEELDIE